MYFYTYNFLFILDNLIFPLFQRLLAVVMVNTQDFPMCNDLSTPHIPPEGVLSQAGYGAPCEKTPCLPGMSCCYNGRYKAVCEGNQMISCRLVLVLNVISDFISTSILSILVVRYRVWEPLWW